MTSDGCCADSKELLNNPMRRCLFGRGEKHVHIIQGIFYYNLPQHLLDLGDDESAEYILNWMALYAEAIAEPLSDSHNEEGAFVLWGMVHYAWQMIEIIDRPDK